MEIKVIPNESTATITVAGKLTVATSPDLEAAIQQLDDAGEVNAYDIDLSELEYISSAGLRVLVGAQKLAMRKGGTMRLLHPTDAVMEVFELTGLADVMDIER